MSAVNFPEIQCQFPRLISSNVVAPLPERFRLAYNKESADCTVRALAVACNISYGNAHWAMQKEGRPLGGSGSAAMMFAASRSLGYRMVRIKPKGKTMLTVGRALVGTFGGFVLVTCDHAAGVWNGYVIDHDIDSLSRVLQTFRMEKRK